MFLGFYDYTVVLTYISLGISVLELQWLWRGTSKWPFSVWHCQDFVICLMEK